jgi:hypothetical protein
MKELIHSRKKRQETRRERQHEQVRNLVHQIVNGTGDLYVHYMGLFAIWCGYASWHEDLRPFFRIDGVDAGASFSIDDAFKEKVRSLAMEWLKNDSAETKLKAIH